jgi:methionyl-tRNA formyltransferase
MTKTHVDIIISFHFDQIFKSKILDSVPLGGINVHPALLPHHRGPFPTFHALMTRDPLFGVTVHKLTAKIDAGNILAQTCMVLSPDITATRSAVVLFDEGRRCVERLLSTIKSTGEMPQGRPYPITAYYPWPSHEDMAKFYGMGRRMVNLGDVCEAISVS